jgi:chromosome segregation protein
LHLKSIKLAGFKSFAEPTVIPVAGRLVGVVGPNGCGKSNVIDAVRWVLGESSAKHLRGETMQDVIFGGTTTRKPQGRASVELLFDNNEGRAPGQWAQYAELSVRRVLTRDGDSQYFINNLHVRRRDVQDIFLGTGLGPRAYAIVEQGMISRIIESKPEEIRVFLEEAAGISKYRERRRETESRLSDSRQHLARTEDIQKELDGRIHTLQSQAEVAAHFNQLRDRSSVLQGMQLLVKRTDAEESRQRAQLDIERNQTEIESHIARLREAERLTEQSRQAQQVSSDALQQHQGRLYEVDSELGQLRQRLENMRSTKSRLEAQRNQLQQELEQDRERLTEEEDKERSLVIALADASQRLEDVRARLANDQEAFIPAERRSKELQTELNALRDELARIEQGAGVARSELRNAERMIQQLQERATKNEQERRGLQAPDLGKLTRLKALVRDTEIQGNIVESQLDYRRSALTRMDSQLAMARADLTEAEGALRRCVAELEALLALQERAIQRGDAHVFLSDQGLVDAPRFWQGITVDAGWEDAVEALLGARLNAVELKSLDQALSWGNEPAAGGQSFYATHNDPSLQAVHSAEINPLGPTLRSKVRTTNTRLDALLDQWMRNAICAPSLDIAMTWIGQLAPGQVIVTQAGHALTSHLLRFFSPRTEIHGALARAREIEDCEIRRVPLEAAALKSRQQLAHLESSARSLRAQCETSQTSLSEIRNQQHQLEVERTQLNGLADRYQQRMRELDRDREEIDGAHKIELQRLDEYTQQLQQLQQHITDQQRAIQAREAAWREANQSLEMIRLAIQSDEKAEQEAVYLDRTAQERLNHSRQSRQQIELRLQQREPQQLSLYQEIQTINPAELEIKLQEQLGIRSEREATLLTARADFDAHAAAVHEHDRARLAAEQALNPLRERMQDLRLKEQEARIHFESAAQALIERAADESELKQQLEARGKTTGLATEIAQLEKAIAALGPVNLAALAELETSQERKAFLDAQVADLKEATETLESAMRKIDRETRELLRNTFDRVNSSFSELFPTLFGGGQARIELTGEEILDAGVLVIAQPPGKKTSSIHLLSGGEKALSALALVFSMFQLNPAPFCLLDEVDAPLDDMNTERYAKLVKKMSGTTQFLFISHNRISMEIAQHLIGITMAESGVSRMVAVDLEEAVRMTGDSTREEIKSA